MTVYEKFINERYVNLFNNFLDKVVEPRLRKEIYATTKIKLKLYGISIRPKSNRYYNIPIEELTDSQAAVYFFIDINPNIRIKDTKLIEILYEMGGNILGLNYENFYNFIYKDETFKAQIEINQRPLYELDYQTDEPINEEIEPSERVIKNICDSEKFCNAQGKITFGQLKSIVENAKVKKLLTDVGEGGYKATLRLLPWFFPQLAVAGFTGSLIRAFNKIFRPALEDTTGYKTWWGKTIMNIFNLVEGELGITDSLSKIFFISDGLLTMLDGKEKIKFARYIAEVAAEKPDDEEVPEYFVENELRNWLNQKFLLDPPLQPKEVKGDDLKPEEEINESKSFEYQDTEEYYQKIDDLLNKFLSTIKIKGNSNFLGFKVLSGKDRYGDFTIKINGIFKEPFSMTDSEKVHGMSRKMIKLIKNNFPFLTTATFHGGSTSTLGNYNDNLKWEKQYINRKIDDQDTEKINESKSFKFEDSEEYYEKVENLLNKFLSKIKIKDLPGLIEYRAIVGKNYIGKLKLTIEIVGIYDGSPLNADLSKIFTKNSDIAKMIRSTFPFLTNVSFIGLRPMTQEWYEKTLKYEKQNVGRKITEENLPFKEKVTNGIKRRVFSEGVDDHELKWHFDKTDRKVKVVKSDGWLLQMDNDLPTRLNEGDIITIPKGVYHRVIKGNGDLIVKIKEY